jgi:hypothetical protein
MYNTKKHFYPVGHSNMFFRNDGNHLLNCTASHPKSLGLQAYGHVAGCQRLAADLVVLIAAADVLVPLQCLHSVGAPAVPSIHRCPCSACTTSVPL